MPSGRRGGPPAWEFGEGLTIPHRKKEVTKCYSVRIGELLWTR